MNRRFLIATLLFLGTSQNSIAQDYALRVDEVITDLAVPLKDQKPETRRTLEVLIRPDARFSGKMQEGSETLTVSGLLHPQQDGKFDLELETVRKSESLAPGVVGNVIDISAARGRITIQLKQALPFAAMQLKTDEQQSGRSTHTEQRYDITLSEYTPDPAP